MGSSESKSTMQFPSYRRKAYYAGSWYEGNPKGLRQTLEGNLEAAELPSLEARRLRAVVCPHAGYAFSGPTAAYSYKAIRKEVENSSKIQTIVVLHPSHHVYLDGCAVSGATALETPLGILPVDNELRQEILALGPSAQFTVMEKAVDEREHSGELQYPYLALVTENAAPRVRVLPIMCGALSTSKEKAYGRALSQILLRDDIITVVSTDFCHWGARFSYTPTGGNNIPIHEFISQLDHQGMDLIAAQKPGAFAEYLRNTGNTICGRHAVAVWLRAVEAAAGDLDGSEYSISFVRYAQSSAVLHPSDSSVSYAAAVATATGKATA